MTPAGQQVGEDRQVEPRRRYAEPQPVEHRILAVNVGERLELVLLAGVGAVHAIGQIADLQIARAVAWAEV